MEKKRRRLTTMISSSSSDSYDQGEYDVEIEMETKTDHQQQHESREKSEGEEKEEEAKPIGEEVRVSGKGKSKRSHFHAFEFDGNTFYLEDCVLLSPGEPGEKPYIAIIKDITQARDGSMMVLGQWFYRPEEAEKRGGGIWLGRDTRELFYSFHRDEVPAESVMHKCQTHFVPLHKQFPDRKVHPGFIVQKIYDTVEKKLWKLVDKDYEDSNQLEIGLLVERTHQRLGELPDLFETNDVFDHEDQFKDRLGLKRKDRPPLDVSRKDGTTIDQHLTVDTPGSPMGEASEFYKILANFKALTRESIRNKWLERLLQAIQCVCDSNNNMQDGDKEKGGSTCVGSNESVNNHSEVRRPNDGGVIRWPDAVVPAVVALEKAAYDAFDYQKFNQKMRQMVFNLRNNNRLAKRLINGELEASVILYMSPNELKDGLTAQETTTKDPEEFEGMQMMDVRCGRCQEKRVGLTDIIKGGGRGDRYQLECIACGNMWYAFRDDVSTVAIDAPSVGGNISNSA